MVNKKTKKILKQFTPKRTNIAQMGSEPLELPNYSGVAHHSRSHLEDYKVNNIEAETGTIQHTPTEEDDIVNKEYVDSLIRGNVELFLTEDASDIGTYLDLATDSTGNPEENTVQAIAANSTTLIAAYASILNEAEIESITDLEQGRFLCPRRLLLKIILRFL